MDTLVLNSPTFGQVALWAFLGVLSRWAIKKAFIVGV
jgi:hypothetical protein